MRTYLNQVRRVFLAAVTLATAISATAQAEERVLHSFERKQLSDVYYSEGANAADINSDGQADVVYGPYWFAGPAFEKKHELYPAKPQNREGYADNFFNWIYDFNGDGWNDIITVAGWFEQPQEAATTGPWPFHAVAFSNAYGGAEMFAYDGDGDNDVITSLAAHEFGLAWYEQDRSGPEPVFRQHLIMGDKPSQNRYGLVFSELHSLALVDIDGDGHPEHGRLYEGSMERLEAIVLVG